MSNLSRFVQDLIGCEGEGSEGPPVRPTMTGQAVGRK